MAQVFKGLNAWRPKNLKWRHAQKPQNPKILKPESPKVQKPKNKPNCPKRVSKNSFIWYIHSYCISRLHQLGNPKALPEYSSKYVEWMCIQKMVITGTFIHFLQSNVCRIPKWNCIRNTAVYTSSTSLTSKNLTHIFTQKHPLTLKYQTFIPIFSYIYTYF